jgi:hypothetical protein
VRVVVRSRRAPSRIGEQHLILRGAFALTSALIVFNKVGSPQYMLWLAPVVAAGLLIDRKAWTSIAVWLAVTCFLTTSCSRCCTCR